LLARDYVGNPLPIHINKQFVGLQNYIVAKHPTTGARILIRDFTDGTVERYSRKRRAWVVVGKCGAADRACTESLRSKLLSPE
jgi:hypothetical protein